MNSAAFILPLALLVGMGGCEPGDPDDSVPTPIEDPAGLEADVEACSDGIDNDLNGYIDCEDFGCLYTGSVTQCEGPISEENTNEACTDGIDNDRDGKLDCVDENCLWNGDVSACDRDRDGYSPRGGDCYDHPNLDASVVVNPGLPEMCGDGLDGDCDGQIDESEDCVELDLGLLRVNYVNDGDTMDIEGLGSVRLKGIDTPENWDGGPDGVECYGPEASNHAKDNLSGQRVRVLLDPTDYHENFQDPYGRWLAHIYLEDGQRYFNGEMVSEGLACVWPNFDCINKVELFQLQDAAQADDIGLWGECGESVCF